MHWKQNKSLFFYRKIAAVILSHILWNHPQQPLHSAICLSTTLLSDFFHGIRQLQYNITFIFFSKHFLMACSVLGNSVTLSSSKQWSKWDLIFEVLNLASIDDLWCDKTWEMNPIAKTPQSTNSIWLLLNWQNNNL